MRVHAAILVLMTAASLLCFPAGARRTTRKGLKAMESSSAAAKQPATYTMQPADSAAVSVSGFEKILRSKKESMFLTNNTADTIYRLTITLNYNDINRRQLHSRRESIDILLPPGETRKHDLQSFDRQGTFYYYLSRPPRSNSQATPFRVATRVDSISIHPANPQL